MYLIIGFFIWVITYMQVYLLIPQRNVAMCATSFIHAMIVLCLSFYIIVYTPDSIKNDRHYGHSDITEALYSITTSYFAFDVIHILTDKKINIGFLVHGVACFIAYYSVLNPYLSGYGYYFLLFELSTPFLNIREFILITGKHKEYLYIIERLFGVTFIISRIIFGIPASFYMQKVFYDSIVNDTTHNIFITVYFSIANITLNGLNIYWLSKLLKKFLYPKKDKI
jgi:hypothetical protein